MPISQTTFLRLTAAMFLVGLVALIGIVGTTFWLVERAQQHFDTVIEARDLRTTTSNLRIALQEMESSQRGFLLTQDEIYLVPYNAARERILPYFGQLAEAVTDLPAYRGRMEALAPALGDKLTEFEQTIALVRDGRRAEALAMVETDRGRRIMEEARALFVEIITNADNELTQGVQEQRASADTLRYVTIVAGILIILVIGGAVWTALNYTRDLLTARAEVEALNAGLEQRVKERTQALMSANEEVQRFAYIVTHDLRAPLVNIMGFTSELDETMKAIQAYVLADGTPLSEQEIQEARTAAQEDMPEAIGFIRSSTRKMDGLINAILKISREGKRPLKPETVDLNALLEANLATIQHQIQAADGTSSLSVGVPAIVSDRLSLEQVVGNLLDNAVKYHASGRPLAVDIVVTPVAGGQVRIDIADNGRGIAPEDHQRVFDLFRRSGQQDKPGEGIGLAHVRTLVRSLGGDITLASALGEGTTFSILLPLDVRTIVRTET